MVDENLSDPADDDPTVVIPFQNENLCAYMELQDGTRTVNSFFYLFQIIGRLFNSLKFQVMASVPDLITILDSQSGSHLGTPECKFLGLMNQRTS